jgi:peptidyl-prolyl cis-trans isomerase SurA
MKIYTKMPLKTAASRHTNMRTIIVLFCFLAAFTSTKADTILVDKVIAVVGDKVVLLSDVELQYEQLKLEQDVPLSAKCELLNSILTSKLFLEAALQDSVAVSDDEVETELDRRVGYFVSMLGGQEQLEEYYGKSILEIKNEFRTDIREQLLSQRMQGKIYSNVKVGPSDVKKFFNLIPTDSLPYFNAEVEVGHVIMSPLASEFSKEIARKKADEVLTILETDPDADFCFLVSRYSNDPGTQDKCGDLGTVGRGEFVTEFEAAAFALEEGEHSGVVETKYGFHIIQMVKKKGNRITVRHILIVPAVLGSDHELVKSKLDGIRDSLVNGTMSFAYAVKKYSEDDETKHQGGILSNPATGSSYFEIGQLDKTIYFGLEGLKPGEYSIPLSMQLPNGQPAYRILFLKSETQPHAANLTEDYYKIQAAALKKKQDEALGMWLEDRIKGTYVWLSPDYAGCLSLKKWFKEDNSSNNNYE